MNAKPQRTGTKPTGKLAELARIQQQGGDKVVATRTRRAWRTRSALSCSTPSATCSTGSMP